MYKHTLEDVQKSVGPGWVSLVTPLYHLCETHDIYISQVKEKYGGLRFYAGPTHHVWVFDLIAIAEGLSCYVCEECGERGELRTDLSWYKTLCDQHYQKRKEGS